MPKLKTFNIRWTDLEYFDGQVEARDAEHAREVFREEGCVNPKSYDSEFCELSEITEVEEVKDA